MRLYASLTPLKQWVSTLATAALDLFYPPVCAGCGVEVGTWWCAACQARVEWLCGAACCRALPLEGDGTETVAVISAARYTDPIARVIQAFKYEATPHLAVAFGAAMVTALRESSLAVATGAVLVPVPLYVQRQRVRGYNHSALLARHIGQALELPVDERTLRRVRNTEQQARIRDDATRQANVRGAFKADPRCANAAQIILVDDVFTTGATLRECALALKAAGAQAVAALTLARARD